MVDPSAMAKFMGGLVNPTMSIEPRYDSGLGMCSPVVSAVDDCLKAPVATGTQDGDDKQVERLVADTYSVRSLRNIDTLRAFEVDTKGVAPQRRSSLCFGSNAKRFNAVDIERDGTVGETDRHSSAWRIFEPLAVVVWVGWEWSVRRWVV
jgi:hypothetical protein